MTIAFAIPQTISFLLRTMSELCKWLLHCTARPASMQNVVTDYRHKAPKAKPFWVLSIAAKHHRRGPKGVQVYLDDLCDVPRVTASQHPRGRKGVSPGKLEDDAVTLE